MVESPPESVTINGFVYDRRAEAAADAEDEAEASAVDRHADESLDSERLERVRGSLQRARQRRPDELNPEPYVMLGGLWISAQLFR